MELPTYGIYRGNCYVETIVFSGGGGFTLNVTGADDAVDDGWFSTQLNLVPNTFCNNTYCALKRNGKSIAQNDVSILTYNFDDDTAGVLFTQGADETTTSKRYAFENENRTVDGDRFGAAWLRRLLSPRTKLAKPVPRCRFTCRCAHAREGHAPLNVYG